MSEGSATPEKSLPPKPELKLDSSLPPKPSEADQRSKRRNLIKGVAAFAAMTGAALWGSKEIKAQKEGIDTPNATFIPLYERHDVGVEAKDIPSDLDIFVREGGGNEEGWPGYAYLRGKGFVSLPGGGKLELNAFQEGALEKLAQNGVKIAFADIDNGVTLDQAREITSVPFFAGVAAALGTMGYTKTKAFVDELKGNTPSKKELSRRHFIQKVGYGSAGIATSVFTSDLLTQSLPVENMGPVGRIITRLKGLESHLHPEDLIVFIRNAFTADKMLTIAEQLKSKKNQKLKIAFNYGSNHSGIEDFLNAGPEVCRVIINMFPKEYLQHVINSNGSAENLASSAVIDLPKDFKISDLENRERALRIQARKITDTKLSQQLQVK